MRKYVYPMKELLHQIKTEDPSPTMKTIAIVISRYLKENQITKVAQT
jgi:hypothetical protein